MSDLHLWRLETEGCTTFIAARDGETALRVGEQDYGVGSPWEGEIPEPVDVSQVPDEEMMRVGFPDDPPEDGTIPDGAVTEQDEGRIIAASATAKAWAENCGDGVYLCETDY